MFVFRKNFIGYTTFGVAFGFCFPIIAITADMLFFKPMGLSWQNIGEAHRLNPLHFIIDTAPLFLGMAFGFVGYKQDQLSYTNAKLQRVLDEVSNQKEEISTQNELMSQKNKEVERKRHDLDASIQYAQSIQNAILPDLRLMKKHLEDLFILHKARDIVSGDFYYFTRKEGRSVLAVADCTGHGIPAAFMSLVGYQHLNNIILQQGILEPQLILEYLHEGIYSTLRQGETNNNDGMDIGICILDNEHHELYFAGSKISLYYVRNNELQKVKANRTYIGGKEYRRPAFDKHTVTLLLDEKTQFYLYTDGYQDQFGGEENTKFLSSRLKALLLTLYQEEPVDQRKILMLTIENWIGAGTKEQTDDILLLGFRA